jgi:P-type Cu2+ transporter
VTEQLWRCLHCEAEILPGAAVVDRSGEVERYFCCKGCLGAYQLITGAGLDDYYRRRQWHEKGMGSGAYRDEFDDDYLARFVHAVGASSSLDILIDGIRCASCVWLMEKVISGVMGVSQVRVNYATGRARVHFDSAVTTPAAIFRRISTAGYRPRPYSSSVAESAYTAQRNQLLLRFGTALFLTMQLMASSFALYAGLLQGMGESMKAVMQWFSLAVTTPVIFYSGWPFLRGAWRSIANRSPGMDLLITVGALSSYIYSIYALFSGAEVYFETAAMIVTLILTGRLLELSARHRASAGVERLLSCAPTRALRLQGDEAVSVESSELLPGDIVLVREGERFPVDGLVLDGTTEVDESPATGEALPVPKVEGDQVIAGSINLLGSVRVRVERLAVDSFIARIVRLVEEAQESRAPIQNLAERLSVFFVPAVLFLALVTFGWLYLSGDPFGVSLMRALAVLVIACPCALGLATPTAVVAGTGAGANAGIIFRGGDILERLSRITRVVFDKTGTLTKGRPQVVSLQPVQGVPREFLLATAAAIESGSGHPLARGIMEYAALNGIGMTASAAGMVTTPGGGIAGVIDGDVVIAGTGRFVEEQGVPLPDDSVREAGSVIHLARNGDYLGMILLLDRLRPAATEVVAYFTDQGIAVTLLSGDRAEHVREIALEAGIGDAVGGLLPSDKVAFVREESTMRRLSVPPRWGVPWREVPISPLRIQR